MYEFKRSILNCNFYIEEVHVGICKIHEINNNGCYYWGWLEVYQKISLSFVTMIQAKMHVIERLIHMAKRLFLFELVVRKKSDSWNVRAFVCYR